MNIPLIALVGRPNVGKSSLFNALTRTRQALVADFSGVTRDRRFGESAVEVLGGKPIRVVDTGGWMPENWRKNRDDKELLQGIEEQVLKALEECAVIVLVMNVREGVTSLDEDIVRYVRRLGRPFVIAANKSDQIGESYQIADFFQLGADEILPVSAEHKVGIYDFWERLLPYFGEYAKSAAAPEVQAEKPIRVCIVGRPNVGKSSLLNQLVGEERSVANSEPGTTTDPVDVEIERNGHKFLLVDTAGIRRQAKRRDEVEDLGVMYAKRNLAEADLAFLVVDSEAGVTAQDSRIAALVEESGCTAILVANKWDNAPRDIRGSNDGLKKFAEMMGKELPFLDYAPVIAISAEKGRLYSALPGADSEAPLTPWNLPESLEDIWLFAKELVDAREQRIPPKEVAELVEEALTVGPQWGAFLGPLRKVHQVGNRPPQFLAMVRDANKIPEAMRRYLSRSVREKYGFRGNPIRWVFKHRNEQKS